VFYASAMRNEKNIAYNTTDTNKILFYNIKVAYINETLKRSNV